MRRLVTALAVVLSTLAGFEAAWGARISGTSGSDRLLGTSGADVIFGFGGPDRLEGRGGPDVLQGGPGRDTIFGGTGDDRIAAQADRTPDSLACGPGRDVVTAELVDAVSADCEVVSRQLSRDRQTGLEARQWQCRSWRAARCRCSRSRPLLCRACCGRRSRPRRA